MKKGKTKKKRQPKKKQIEPVDRHIRHELIGNNNFYGEEVVKYIIDKLISLSITTQNAERIYSTINTACFTHIKNEISSLIQQDHLSYERDELLFPEFHMTTHSMIIPDELEHISKRSNEYDKEEHNNHLLYLETVIPNKNTSKIYYDLVFEKNNFWGEIPEPMPSTRDREATTQIEYVRYFPSPKKDEHTSAKNNVTLNKRGSDKWSKIPLKKKSSSSLMNLLFSGNSNSTINNVTKEAESTSAPKRKGLLTNLPYFDIPQEKLPLFKELPEITSLRNERERQIKLKDEEMKRQMQNELNNKNIERTKHFSMNKNKTKVHRNFTVDSKGEIVIIKTLPLDQLVIEFTAAKTNQRDISRIQDPLFVKKKSLLMNRRSISVNKKEEVIKNTNGLEQPQQPVIVEAARQNKRKNTLQNTVNKIANVTNALKQSNITIVKPMPMVYRVGAKSEILPCGSLFDLIKPEVGVTILEDSKMKTGGKDFFKKYKKVSVESFRQTYKETLMNKTASTIDFNPRHNENKEEQHNQMNPKELLVKNKQVNQQENKVIMPIQGKHIQKSNSAASIIMSSHKYSSIRTAIDNLDLLNEQDENVMNDQRSMKDVNMNLFEQMKRKKYDNKTNTFYIESMRQYNNNSCELEFSEINNFTKTLMNTNQWGTKPHFREKPTHIMKHYIKPQQRDLQREIGINISKIKMPRSRIKQSAQDILMNNTAKFFHRQKLLQQSGLSFYKPNSIIEPTTKE